jgi:hypothetical protein
VGKRIPSWLRHLYDHELNGAKQRYDAGEKGIIWSAICVCDLHGVSLTDVPDWLQRAVMDYAWEYGVKKPVKMGRPSEAPRHRQIVAAVDRYRQQKRRFGRKGKLRRISPDEAFRLVQKDWAARGLSLSTHTIKFVYYRHRKLSR